MVQSAGLEPATSSFAGRRSNPTELRLHNWMDLLYRFFWNVKFFSIFFKNYKIFKKTTLFGAWHSVKIKSFSVDHGFSDIIFLFSLFKKSSFIKNSHFYQLFNIFGWKFFLWEVLLILQIAISFFVWLITSHLTIFITNKNLRSFFLVFGKFACGSLFFYESWWKSVRIRHENAKIEN